MLRSSTSTSGWWPRTYRRAPAMSPASATTSKPPSASSTCLKPRRTTE
jgi:hypothetical protein